LPTTTNQKKLIVIAGPTAVGKTAISIQLAKQLNCDIISADSRQVYKELSIGTAKPCPEEMQGVFHHFIDFISIHQHYNAGIFEKDVITFLENYFLKKDVVILCGGTGMYIDAVCNGMDEFQAINEHLRNELTKQYKTKGINWLQEEVEKLDPIFYSVVDKQNPARLLRALEICISTGLPYSSQRKGKAKKRNFSTLKILINDDRIALYNRINKRVDTMIDKGLIEEAKSVYPYKNNKALNTVGYKELFDYFDGKVSLEKAIELIKQNTRNYAKRQLTWFNSDAQYHSFFPTQFNEMMLFLNEKLTTKS